MKYIANIWITFSISSAVETSSKEIPTKVSSKYLKLKPSFRAISRILPSFSSTLTFKVSKKYKFSSLKPIWESAFAVPTVIPWTRCAIFFIPSGHGIQCTPLPLPKAILVRCKCWKSLFLCEYVVLSFAGTCGKLYCLTRQLIPQ